MICYDLAISSSITLPDGAKVTPVKHESCRQTHHSGNHRQCSGASLDPVYTGRFIADSNGQVKFGFQNNGDGHHVKFSGITVRACGQAGKMFFDSIFSLVLSSMSREPFDGKQQNSQSIYIIISTHRPRLPYGHISWFSHITEEPLHKFPPI